jgi:hypothetical protein
MFKIFKDRDKNQFSVSGDEDKEYKTDGISPFVHRWQN